MQQRPNFRHMPAPAETGAFERAQNVRELPDGLGDPERWGGAELFRGVVKANFAGQVVLQSKVLARAQCEDLLARQWLLLATYEVSIEDPTNSGKVTLASIDLDCQWGTGQAVAAGAGRIFPVPANSPAAWTAAATASAGVVEVGVLPGCMVQVNRAVARFTAAAGGPPTDVQLAVTIRANLAPRAI